MTISTDLVLLNLKCMSSYHRLRSSWPLQWTPCFQQHRQALHTCSKSRDALMLDWRMHSLIFIYSFIHSFIHSFINYYLFIIGLVALCLLRYGALEKGTRPAMADIEHAALRPAEHGDDKRMCYAVSAGMAPSAASADCEASARSSAAVIRALWAGCN